MLNILLIFAACNGMQNNHYSKDDNIAIANKSSIQLGTKVSNYLGQVSEYMAFSLDGKYMALYSNDTGYIVVTDTTGSFVSKFGGKGSGPKEFNQILQTGFNHNNEIAVLDSRQKLYKFFDLSGSLLKTAPFKLEEGYAARGRFLFYKDSGWFSGLHEIDAIGEYWNSDLVMRLDEDFNINETFGKIDKANIPEGMILDGIYIGIDRENKLAYLIQRSSPNLYVYDLDDHTKVDLLTHQSEHYQNLDKPILAGHDWQTRKEMVYDQSLSDHPYITSDYVLIPFSNVTPEHFASQNPADNSFYIKIYTAYPEHEYLGEVALPGPLMGVHPNGQLYLLQDDDPNNVTLGVYEINE